MKQCEIIAETQLVLPVYAASAMFAGFTHQEAVERIVAGVSEMELGVISPKKIQLCPQNTSTLDEQSCQELTDAFRGTEFRIHANTSCGKLFGLYDASSQWNSGSFLAWKKQLKLACGRLGAKAYSWHAGRADRCTLSEAIRHTKELEQELGIPVGMEGLYPSKTTPWLMQSFDEYEQVMKSGINYALDLSHWEIITKSIGVKNEGLLVDMLTSAGCMEIHLSDNDGRRDKHQKLERKPFWFSILCNLQARGVIKADVFSEGLQESKLRAKHAI
jgi:hypothetical protein